MSRARAIVIALVTVFLAEELLRPAKACANPAVILTRRLLAILLDVGRVTVGTNQSFINDPERGDKGFKIGRAACKVRVKFKERAGVEMQDLQNERVPPMAQKLLLLFVEAHNKTAITYYP